MGNVNRWLSLGKKFINILWENDKEINFFTAFYIFQEWCQNFPKMIY